MQLLKAERKQVTIKLAIQGPSGSGKTYSSLRLAYGLVSNWNKISIIDAENNSSHLYSHLGNYNVLSLSEPFSPEHYIEAISFCERAGMKVIIIDSISPEWESSEGILGIHSNMAGNSFTNWNRVTPRHNAFVQKILQSSSHVIATIRSKQDYVLTDKNGKMVPEKVGLKGITRDGAEYDYTLVFDVDIKHLATVSKDRTQLFTNPMPFIITEQTGSKIRAWCQGEDLIRKVESQINEAKTIQDLRNILIEYPTLRKEIEPVYLNRKAQIEGISTDQVVNPKTE